MASATTIVAKVEKDRIILAADTRTGDWDFTRSGATNPQDDYCKITALGRVGFAVAGDVNYKKNDPADPVPDWSAADDARTSYQSHPDSIVQMADDWKNRAIQHFTTFYFASAQHRGLLTQLASASDQHVLLIAFFAGWDSKGQPTVIAEHIALSQGPFMISLNPIISVTGVLGERDLPYSTNAWTNKLSGDDPEMASAFAKEWREKSKKFPKSEIDWRRVEFLVQSTNAYDKTVGKDADVMEIKASGSVWLHRKGCAKQQKAP